jgi:hypothetical protein
VTHKAQHVANGAPAPSKAPSKASTNGEPAAKPGARIELGEPAHASGDHHDHEFERY